MSLAVISYDPTANRQLQGGLIGQGKAADEYSDEIAPWKGRISAIQINPQGSPSGDVVKAEATLDGSNWFQIGSDFNFSNTTPQVLTILDEAYTSVRMAVQTGAAGTYDFYTTQVKETARV